MTFKRSLYFSLFFSTLVVVLLLLSSHVEGFRTLERKYVKVRNDLGDGVPLTIHCGSRDDDIGEHVLNFGATLGWNFRPNILVANTLFWCHANWSNGTKSFDIYQSTRDDERCTTCRWSVRTGGIYFFNEWSNAYEVEYGWDPPPPPTMK